MEEANIIRKKGRKYEFKTQKAAKVNENEKEVKEVKEEVVAKNLN